MWVDRSNTAGVLELLERTIGLASAIGEGEKKAAVSRLLEKLTSAEMIFWFMAGAKEKEAVEEYVTLAASHAVDSLVLVLGEIEDRRMRKFICSVLADSAAREPSRFGKYLDDERWYLVRNIVMILGMGRNREAVKLVERAVQNPEVRVRRECIKSLDTIGTDEIRKPLIQMMSDPDSTTRTYALKALRRLGGGELFDFVSECVRREDFKGRPFPEKREFLEAYGALGGEKAFPALAGFFRKKGFLFRQDENLEMRAAAAYGLGYVATAGALELLRKGAGSRKSLFREACVQALNTAQDTRK
jgi:HEAT repeat protein